MSESAVARRRRDLLAPNIREPVAFPLLLAMEIATQSFDRGIPITIRLDRRFRTFESIENARSPSSWRKEAMRPPGSVIKQIAQHPSPVVSTGLTFGCNSADTYLPLLVKHVMMRTIRSRLISYTVSRRKLPAGAAIDVDSISLIVARREPLASFSVCFVCLKSGYADPLKFLPETRHL